MLVCIRNTCWKPVTIYTYAISVVLARRRKESTEGVSTFISPFLSFPSLSFPRLLYPFPSLIPSFAPIKSKVP